MLWPNGRRDSKHMGTQTPGLCPCSHYRYVIQNFIISIKTQVSLRLPLSACIFILFHIAIFFFKDLLECLSAYMCVHQVCMLYFFFKILTYKRIRFCCFFFFLSEIAFVVFFFPSIILLCALTPLGPSFHI